MKLFLFLLGQVAVSGSVPTSTIPKHLSLEPKCQNAAATDATRDTYEVDALVGGDECSVRMSWELRTTGFKRNPETSYGCTNDTKIFDRFQI